MSRHNFHYWAWIEAWASEPVKTPESFMAMHRRAMARARRWRFVRSLVIGGVVLYVTLFMVTS